MEGNQNLSPSACYNVIEPITVHYEDSDKGTVFGEFFTDHPSIDILYYPKERDDKEKKNKSWALRVTQESNTAEST